MLLTSYADVDEVVLDKSEFTLEVVLIALDLFHEKAPSSTCQFLNSSLPS
jgi:hypothetical protein